MWSEACVPHNYMIGAFVYGDPAGTHAASTLADVAAPQALPDDQIRDAHALIYRPLRHPDGPPKTPPATLWPAGRRA